MNKYDQQAEDFMKKTGTKIKISFLKKGLHFADDKMPRDIYRVRISRGRKSFTLQFGQSITETIEKTAPRAYDILVCLTKNDPGRYEDFTAEYGELSYGIYHAVCKEWKQVSRLFTDEEIEQLQDIQ